MAFKDCLVSAVEQNAITREEAAELADHFEELRAQLRLALGDEAAAAAAKQKLEEELRRQAIEQKRRAVLAAQAARRISAYLRGYRNAQGRPDVFAGVLNLFEHFGYAGTSSIAGRAKAIVSLAHGQMADVLTAFRRSAVSGRRMNVPLARDVVRAIIDGNAAKPEVKAMAEAISGVLEDLRQRFNAAGGAIGKIEGGYLPQFHDPRALLNAGRAAWKEWIAPRLDMARMRDPLTGEPITQARLDQALDHVFDAITTDGWADHRPVRQARSRGALAGQRAEHRFLVFRNADAWLEYDREFGSGDPIRTVFDHINGMARDIAALEILGPNPNATVEWLKQIVQNEAGKAVAGKPSLYNMGSRTAAGAADRLDYLGWRIDSVYQYVRGRRTVSNSVAAGFGTVRNLITSAVLGSASITAAATDPFLDRAARHLSGLPMRGALTAVLKTFSRSTREEALRSGVLLDDFLHIMGDEARWAGTLGGAEWSRWLADRTVTWSGLQPMTQARKHVFAREFEATLADHAGTRFEDLPPYLRRTMEGYGLDRTAWDVMRQTPLHRPEGGAGFLRPIDVAALADGPALPGVQKLLGIDATDAAAAAVQTKEGVRRIAEIYLEMILGQTERAVPSGTARARSFLTGAQPRGTWINEILEGGLQFKSFALSFTALQLEAIAHEGGLRSARGAKYAASLALTLTLGGALALQLKNIANGKDPQDMNDAKFWLHALSTGGGIGLLGDFLFADVNRYGYSLGEQLVGPQVQAAWDVGKITVGNLQELALGKDTNIGRESVNLAGRYTPVLSSLWYLRGAYRFAFLDNLQRLLDPEADRSFREHASRLRRETGQERFWRRGELLPERAPRF